MRVDVSFLPPTRPPGDRTCLVVDVLRATSSVAVLLARGVEAVYPTPGVDQARALRARLGLALLCGEVNALPPAGFDFGNSPSEFERADLPASTVVMATTNGTPALLACSDAPLVLAAAPLNASACVAIALEARRDVLVVAAGRRGAYAEDDALAAGLLAGRMVEAGATPGPDAERAIGLWWEARDRLATAFRETRHGRDLVALGFGHDLDVCAQTDRFSTVGALRAEPEGFVLRPVEAS